MSIATDVENGYTAFKNELARLDASLPALIAKGRQLEESPLGQLAARAAQAVADSVIPPEAVSLIEGNAAKLFDDLMALYAPQQAAPAEPAQAPAA